MNRTVARRERVAGALRVVRCGVRIGLTGVAVARLAGAARRSPPLRADAPTSGAQPADAPPSISVVVPARDEERRLAPLLDALADAPGVSELIVVDDCSSDGTAALARDAGARVVTGAPLPEGWAGKAWALQQGLAHASGKWVVTLDADTRPDPRLPAAAVARAEADGVDMLTVGGSFSCPTVPLQVLHPAMLTTLVLRVGLGDTVPPPRPERSMANGQCMVLRRAALLAAGGLTPVGGQLVEDVALARHLARTGHRVAMVSGPQLLDVHMYDSAREAWRGWGRSLALPGVDPLRRQLFDLAVLTVMQVLPLARVLTRRAGPLDVIALALRAGTLAGTASAYRSRRATYWLSPLADPVAVAAVAVGVAQEHLGVTPQWRGRSYPSRRGSPAPARPDPTPS